MWIKKQRKDWAKAGIYEVDGVQIEPTSKWNVNVTGLRKGVSKKESVVLGTYSKLEYAEKAIEYLYESIQKRGTFNAIFEIPEEEDVLKMFGEDKRE